MIYLLSVLFLFNNLNSQIVMDNSIHQFVVNNINGDSFDFSTLKGKKIMIVNTASKCGLTPQYKKLQFLYHGKHLFGFHLVLRRIDKNLYFALRLHRRKQL